MAFHRYSKAEKEAYRQGKIRTYYKMKNKCKKEKNKAATKEKPRYGNFNVSEAFEAALKRTYGDNTR